MNTEKNILDDKEVGLDDKEVGSSTGVTDRFDFDKFSVDHNLQLYVRLKNHNEDVSAMTFNSTGRLLVAATGKNIKYWEWESKSEQSWPKSEKFSFPHCQHYLTDLQTMPQSSNNEKIVTCGSSGEVNLVSVSNSAIERKMLGKHQKTASQLAILDQDTFYTCGADSVVKLFDLREADHSVKDVIKCRRHPLKKQFSSPRLSTIAVDPINNNMFSIGGSELTLRTYDIRKCSVGKDDPVEMIWHSDLDYRNSQTVDWIKKIAYSCKSELLVFREIGQIFLFDKTISPGLPSVSAVKEAGKQKLHAKVMTYEGSEGGRGFSYMSFFGGEDDYVLGTTDDGFKLYIWDKKRGGPENRLGNNHIKMTRIARHPFAPVLATAGDDLWIWAPI